MANGNVPTAAVKLRGMLGSSLRKNDPNKWEHWKYPLSIGADTLVDDVNFNSNQTSEYAIERMSTIDELSVEPFMMFEFMKINEDRAAARKEKNTNAVRKYISFEEKDLALEKAIIENQKNQGGSGPANRYGRDSVLAGLEKQKANNAANKGNSQWADIKAWMGQLFDTAERDYTGSVAIYMPTDIQINDQLVYNEDTRKIGAIFESMLNKPPGDWDLWNPTIALDPLVTATIGTALGKRFSGNTGAAIGAFATYGIGDILQTELQRATGQIANPNELLRYASTGLRTFTFNWTFLPDSEDESKQVTGLIQLFRRSAHAKRDSSTLIIVPDHVVVSFHGAADMVQIPPCYIESVNVNYNPNNSSFFSEGNRPVEIKFGVTLKEIVPIYQHNIDEGY